MSFKQGLILGVVFLAIALAGSAGISYGVVELSGAEGPRGEQGEQGPKGATGARGASGATGASNEESLLRDARIANAVVINSLVSNFGGYQSSGSAAGKACFAWLLLGEGSATECGFTR